MVFIRCDYLPAMRTGLYATPNPAAMMPAAVLMKPPIPGGAEAHEPESDDRGDERDHVDDGAHRVIEYGSVRRGRMVGNIGRAGFRDFFELGVRRVVGHVLLRSKK